MKTGAVALHPTRCAICGTEGNATELYPATLGQRAFTAPVFSARRTPDGLHYRIVRCDTCGLVRSDPAADAAAVAELYAASSLTYAEETANLAATYGRYLSRLTRYAVRRDALLDVGCGNGFFLAEAKARGYREAWGVEPGRAAVAAAEDGLRPFIVCDRLRPGLFGNDRFDAVCLFQVFDHIAEPGPFLDELYAILRPGGLLLFLHHNVRAFTARALGGRSPIVDVEHPFLYSLATMRRMMANHRFQVKEAGPAWNRCSVRHLARLAPLPGFLKRLLLAHSGRGGGLSLWVPLGNLYLIARKPAEADHE